MIINAVCCDDHFDWYAFVVALNPTSVYFLSSSSCMFQSVMSVSKAKKCKTLETRTYFVRLWVLLKWCRRIVLQKVWNFCYFLEKDDDMNFYDIAC